VYDVIECFLSTSPTKQTRQIVFQTPSADLARSHADELWSNCANGLEIATSGHMKHLSGSTYVVVNRSTAQELYWVPNKN
jgi:hypothetical protein